MEVFPLKHQQFKPVVLFLPGQENEDKNWAKNASKPLFKEDPGLWKTFRRLSMPQRGEKVIGRKFNCDFVPPTVTYPDSEGMKCMCYENLMSIIRHKVCIPPPRLYRVPTGKPPTASLESIRPSWVKRALQGFHDNKQLQYPLATVIVRWQLKRQLPKYDPKTLRYILEPYGEVRDIRITSPNSCLVIFKDISSACRVIQTRCLGYPTNNIHCTWWHTAMTNKSIVARAKKLSVKTDPFIL